MFLVFVAEKIDEVTLPKLSKGFVIRRMLEVAQRRPALFGYQEVGGVQHVDVVELGPGRQGIEGRAEALDSGIRSGQPEGDAVDVSLLLAGGYACERHNQQAQGEYSCWAQGDLGAALFMGSAFGERLQSMSGKWL